MSVFLLLITGVFLVYFLGISHSVFGGDSGDIILASWFGGVAHPPGYPLNTMVGWIFTHLPFSATVAFKANLMSAVLQAASIGILFLTLRLLTKNVFASLAASLTLAFTPLFWLYAHVAEVFQLLVVLVATSVYFLLLWRDNVIKKYLVASRRFLYFSAFFLGLSVFHHQTAVLALPAFGYLIYKTDKNVLKARLLVRLLGVFVLGFLPYLFVPLAALRETPINWNDPVTFSDFARLITRADYGTFSASRGLVGSSAMERIWQIVSYFYFVKLDFTLVGAVLALLGSIYVFFKEKVIFWFLVLAVILSGPFFVAYASFTLVGEFFFGVWERFILLSYFFLAIFLGFGFLGIYELFFKTKIIMGLRLNLIKNKKKVLSAILGLSFLLFPMVLFLVNWPKTDLSQYKIGDYLGHDVLATAEPNSIIFLFDDTLVFNTQYFYYTTSEFKDRKIIVGGSLKYLSYRQQLTKTYEKLNFPDDFLAESSLSSSEAVVNLVKANLDDFPIYSYSYVPVVEGKKWVHVGLLEKLVSEDSKKDGEYLRKVNNESFARFWQSSLNLPSFYSHFVTDHIKLIYWRAHLEAGNVFLENGLSAQALDHFEDAKSFVPRKVDAIVGLSKALVSLNDCEGAKAQLLKVYEIDRKNLYVLSQLVVIFEKCGMEEDAKTFQKLYETEKQKLEPTI